MTAESPVPSFSELGLSTPVLEALTAVGYETPSPIQAQTIPVLLGGSDVLGQAQTGTGKTAAFALPLLSRIDLSQTAPQGLVLVPTRELAIQVSEAFQKYAAQMRGFHVLPIYGGQSYTPQLKGLKRGAHVIVGTPGRLIDHIKSGVLDVSTLRFVVLDEGDEMLQMGFVDDIEWILEQAPQERQIALFSATMPPAIRRIAQKHMRDPQHITIQNRAATAPKIRQRVWFVSGMHKLDALTRMLEVETFDALLIFVRTKLETVDLAERLEARGFSAAPLNGDIPQQQREKTVARLKNGQLDIVVATDVAARGLDVERISHVVNYDIPYDAETYVHRIGRTGRAGRSGEAILFVAPRERNMLRIIERVTRSRIEPMSLPSVSDVNEHRVLKFKERVSAAVSSGEGQVFRELLEQMEREQNIPAIEIAAALAGLLQGDAPFLLGARPGREESARTGAWPNSFNESAAPAPVSARSRDKAPARRVVENVGGREAANEPEVVASSQEDAPASVRERAEKPAAVDDGETLDVSASAPDASSDASSADEGPSGAPSFDAESSLDSEASADRPASRRDDREDREHSEARARRPRDDSEGGTDNAIDMETFRLEVGHVHGVLPGNIVGAIANEAGLDGKHIGHIDIREDHSFVDLPAGMPKEIFRELKKVKIRGTELRISRVDSKPPRPERAGFRPRRNEGDREFAPRRGGGARDREFAPRRGGVGGSGERDFAPRSASGGGERATGEGFRPREAGDRPFRPREAGDRPFRPREAGDRPFRPREAGDRPFRPREAGDRPFRPREAGDRPFRPRRDASDSGFRPRESSGGTLSRRAPSDLPPRDRESSGAERPRSFADRPRDPAERPREFRPGKPHGIRASKPGPRGFSKGPRKTFKPRER